MSDRPRALRRRARLGRPWPRMAWQLSALAALLASLLPGAPVFAQAESTARPEAWREDLSYLAAMLPRLHANAFHTLDRQEFERRVDALDRRISSLSDPEIVVELARIVAAVGDGHTRLEFAWGSPGVSSDPAAGFRSFPVRLHSFSDGTHVRSAASRYGSVVGGRVLRVGEVPIERAMELAATVSHHDNPMLIRFLAPLMLTRPAVLYSLGMAPTLDSAALTVAGPGGDTVTVTLTPGREEDDPTAVNARDAGPTPLHARRPGRNYWLEHLAGDGILYVRYRSVRDHEEGESIAEFAGRLASELSDPEVERLVIDLRGNDGGDGALNRPLLHAVVRSPRILERGRIFVLVDRLTFSAAMRFAVDLETHTPAIFVGEPTASRPNQYGEIEQFALPRSGLLVSYASLYFQSAGPLDDRPWIGPELAAEPSADDHRNGRDPAMAAIRAHIRAHPSGAPSLRDRLATTVAEAGVEAGLERYRTWRDDPVHRYARSEAALTAMAYRLWLDGRPEDAEPFFELAADEYPKSYEALENLGEIYLANGRRKVALDATLRSLRLHPGNGDAVGELREICAETVGLTAALPLLDVSKTGSADVVRALCGLQDSPGTGEP